METYPFRAWIPTALGSLSFRKIGETSHPEKSLAANLVVNRSTGGEQRIIVVSQRRDLSDALFKSFFRRFRVSQAMHFVAVLSADRSEGNTEGQLNGFVGIFYSNSSWEMERPSLGGESCGQAIKKAIRSLHDWEAAAGITPDMETLLEKISRACKFLDVTVKCIIERNGLVKIGSALYLDEYVKENSQKFAQRFGMNLIAA